ncbi:hypothetical protein F183_A26420 [Bryobacterales bacterium F-183]|nr:hypothetical protein F183_A26420 [Bryobacterales bacterium F-183]
MSCLRGLIVSADAGLSEELQKVAGEAGSRVQLRVVGSLRDEAQLEATVRLYMPSIVFLDVTEVEAAERVCTILYRLSRSTQVIGVARNVGQDALLMAIRCKLRDVLVTPLQPSMIYSSLERATAEWQIHQRLPIAQHQIVSFLPSKIGSGASTVALQTAFAMSTMLEKSKVNLMDMDFEAGAIDFMLKLPFEQGLSNISEFGSQLDETIWAKVVKRYATLDVMRAGSGESKNPTPRDIEHVLGFARSSYDYVCVDLQGSLTDCAQAVLENSDTIFLVTTPELHAVHLAKRRMEQLRGRGLAPRVKVILNRHHGRAALTPKDLEGILRTDLFAVLDNDYAGLQRALLNGRPVDSDTPLGRQFADLSRRLCGIEAPSSESQRPSLPLWWRVARRMLPFAKPTVAVDPTRMLGAG